MEGEEWKARKRQLHKAVRSEPKARSTLAEELRISEPEVEDLANSLIGEGLLEKIEDDPEPRYKYRMGVQNGLDKMRDAGLA